MGGLSATTSVRAPAVAGLFYPGDPDTLRATVDELLRMTSTTLPPPKALVVPHAGYPYSGPVAAAAYALLQPVRERIHRVVMIGPAHRVYLQGIAVPRAPSFATPLGDIALDVTSRDHLLQRGNVLASDTPHTEEHSLEVQLPFLQRVLDHFTLLPLVVGSAHAALVAEVLEAVWGEEDTLIVVSSDLSHYHTYDAARAIDAATAALICARRADLTHKQACGATGLNGLLELAKRKDLTVTEIARLNSGDTAGDRHRVVGYGAFALYEPGLRSTH